MCASTSTKRPPVGLDIDHASEIQDLASLETRGLPLSPAPPARDRAPG
jgi:hypothetical protein